MFIFLKDTNTLYSFCRYRVMLQNKKIKWELEEKGKRNKNVQVSLSKEFWDLKIEKEKSLRGREWREMTESISIYL